MPTHRYLPARRPVRLLTLTCVLALLAAVTCVLPSHHPPEHIATTSSTVVYPGPSTDTRRELVGVLGQVQLAAFYTWASNQPPRRTSSGTARASVVEGNLGAQQAQADGVWDRIAACESGGNWSINTGNGYYGGLQMNMSFWHSYGGDEYATRPDLASRSQQIVVAERARDSGRGYRPWPVCGRRA